MSKIEEINKEIEKIKNKNTFNMQDVQALCMLWGASQLLNQDSTPQQEELTDIFPALKKYQKEHTIENLQKLCVEIKEFCHSVYASTQNETEQNIYKEMIKKL
jgi:hypothetical protein